MVEGRRRAMRRELLNPDHDRSALDGVRIEDPGELERMRTPLQSPAQATRLVGQFKRFIDSHPDILIVFRYEPDYPDRLILGAENRVDFVNVAADRRND